MASEPTTAGRLVPSTSPGLDFLAPQPVSSQNPLPASLFGNSFVPSNSLSICFGGRNLGPGPEQGRPLGSPGGSSLTALTQLPQQDLVVTTGFCTVALAPVRVAWGHPGPPCALCTLSPQFQKKRRGSRERRRDRSPEPVKCSHFLSLGFGSGTLGLPGGGPVSRRRLMRVERTPGLWSQASGIPPAVSRWAGAHSRSRQTSVHVLVLTLVSGGTSNMLHEGPGPQFLHV